MSPNESVLVGDVGGTHARFAVADPSTKPFRIAHHLEFDADAFPSFEAVLRAYLDRTGLSVETLAASIAIAGPVTDGRVHLTNRGWQTSEKELRKLGFRRAFLINDFAALAFSVPAMEHSSFRSVGPDLSGLPGEPITILGAGTGFGVSCLARYRGRSVPVATEGGHTGFAPRNERQMSVLGLLAKKFGHVSVERILSGPGLENVYAALAELEGRRAEPLTAPEIVSRAYADDRGSRDALAMFCTVYGAVAGDFALAHGARGGAYIAGGIAEKIEDFLNQSEFRAAFEDKGRLSYYVKPIPTKLVVNADATFLGAALASREFRDTTDPAA